MLHLLLGRAKSGKTATVMEELRRRVEEKQNNNILLVPEQYSHEAETELLRVCGDALSLYAEVLSFSRLATRVQNELGSAGRRPLDGGGRLLCLARALEAVGPRLKIFRAARRQTALPQALLRAIDECKSACLSPEALREPAVEPALGEKLDEVALIYEAYEAVAGASGLDPMDRLTLLAEQLGESRLAAGRWYIDGFTDFTAQQLRVLETLLRAGAELTVCLSCEGLSEGHEVFEPSRRAAARLRALAESLGVHCKITLRPQKEADTPMEVLERELFAFGEAHCDAPGAVKIYRAASVAEECEQAAATCLSLAREHGLRWRDIAVAARDFERYRSGLETAFAHYGVPLYAAQRSDILSKPLPALIASAYAAVTRGWEYDDVLTGLKTGLAGLTAAECDTMENYAFLWSLHGTAWSKDEDWVLHPDGFGRDFDEDSLALLAEINALRRRAMGPLWVLARESAAAVTAFEQAAALAAYFDALALPEQLEQRAADLHSAGMEQTAAEYVQLWEIITGALEQAAAILGDAEMDAERFGELFCLVLSAYDVGTIPLLLDRVGAGDMGRMRRRHLRHLIVLGCDSETLPTATADSGVFTDTDRELLRAAGMELGDSADGRLNREFALIYNCLTLPEESLTLSWCALGSEGGPALPSFVVTRASAVFSAPIRELDPDRCRENAPGPAFELAASAHSPLGQRSAVAEVARRWFSEQGRGDALAKLDQAARLTRGKLSPGAVRALYGPRPRLSASRIDRLANCGFAFFLEFGLKAKPKQPAEFSPPELGSFMHYVLEHVARDAAAQGGFRAVTAEDTDALCDRWVEQYIHDKLWDFRQKSPRFVYLFRRLEETVRTVVADMAEELRRGDFEPLDFELDFGSREGFPPLALGEGEDSLVLTGIADRVDGWVHDGRLYLRVVDYKTGKKSFSLSDVWYGMGLQMLLYLFALDREGAGRYGREIVPAGVLYIPARDALVSAPGRLSPESMLAEKAKQHKRSGLLLDEAEVLDAMERGEEKRYLPVKLKKGFPEGDALASAERFGLLSRHIDRTLRDMAKELKAGSIAADPWFRSQTENACRFCDYREACHFNEKDDRLRYLTRLKAPEVWERLEQGEENHGL
ncbi:MAG: PD-(D/E)XK nuclease family protein [Oscillospiraceae bacterium]|nr:PD-(D/E)XK nuclease family protein [Oscillospiraceae bacterium]